MKVDREGRTPLYIQVYERVLKEIREGRFKKGAYLPSENELGELFGVDRQTVRRSLEILVGEGLVQKRPGLGSIVVDAGGSRSSGQSGRALEVVFRKGPTAVERVTEPFMSRLFSALESEAALRGLALVYKTVGADDDVAAVLLGPSIVGVAFISSQDDSVLTQAADLPLPTVIVNGFAGQFVSVLPDEEEGAYQATRHLLEIGHRRIAHISGPAGYVTSVRRLQGYRRALFEAGIPERDQSHAQGDWTFDGGFRAMQQLLSPHGEAPTAVFASNDQTAIGAIAAVRSAEMSVPADMSVIGFDNIEQCRQMNPNVSSVDVDVRLMARAACHVLLCDSERGTLRGTQILVPTRLQLRQSTAGPAKKRRRA